MAISLKKGQKIELTKTNPNLNKVHVGLGWDTNNFQSNFAFDLDASVFLTDSNGKCQKDTDFVFYGNLTHDSGAVQHSGDNLTGEGEGDDEIIFVELQKIPQTISKIVFTTTIYDATLRNQNFGQVSNAYIRIVDEVTQVELLRFDLGEDFSVETALVVGEIYRHNGEWKFNAIGSGYQGGLKALCLDYGLNVN